MLPRGCRMFPPTPLIARPGFVSGCHSLKCLLHILRDLDPYSCVPAHLYCLERVEREPFLFCRLRRTVATEGQTLSPQMVMGRKNYGTTSLVLGCWVVCWSKCCCGLSIPVHMSTSFFHRNDTNSHGWTRSQESVTCVYI